MKITVKVIDDSSKWSKYKEGIRRLGTANVTVGVHQGAAPEAQGVSVQEVALFNEFGTRTIPERSFLRSTVDESGGMISASIEEILKAAEAGRDVRKPLEALGFKLKELVQKKIMSNVPPPYGSGKGPNSPEEVARRQEAKRHRGAIMGDTTLVETGRLLRSIGYKVNSR